MHGKPEHTPPILPPTPPREVALSQRDLHLSLTAFFLLPPQYLLAFGYTTLAYILFSYAYFGVWFELMTRAHKKWGLRQI